MESFYLNQVIKWYGKDLRATYNPDVMGVVELIVEDRVLASASVLHPLKDADEVARLRKVLYLVSKG